MSTFKKIQHGHITRGLVVCHDKCFNIKGLVQERHKSSALAMELRLSCTNPSICYKLSQHYFMHGRERCNSSAMELHLSCTNPSICDKTCSMLFDTKAWLEVIGWQILCYYESHLGTSNSRETALYINKYIVFPNQTFKNVYWKCRFLGILPGVQWTVCRHWWGWWLGAVQAKCHCLNKWRPGLLTYWRRYAHS